MAGLQANQAVYNVSWQRWEHTKYQQRVEAQNQTRAVLAFQMMLLQLGLRAPVMEIKVQECDFDVIISHVLGQADELFDEVQTLWTDDETAVSVQVGLYSRELSREDIDVAFEQVFKKIASRSGGRFALRDYGLTYHLNMVVGIAVYHQCQQPAMREAV